MRSFSLLAAAGLFTLTILFAFPAAAQTAR